jgi:uncharacterized protein (TIGR02145 family)
MKISQAHFIAILLMLILSVQNYAKVEDTIVIRHKTIKIGDDSWTMSNLNVDRFKNGDRILEAKSESEWKIANQKMQPVFAYYNFDSANESKYGKLYNWFAVSDKRGLAPKGFHIPSEIEYKEMIDTLGGNIDAGNSIKSTHGWKTSWPFSLRRNKRKFHKDNSEYHCGNGTNESGFNALPAGIIHRDGKSLYKGMFAHFWTSTKCVRGQWDIKYNQPDKAVLFDLKYHEGGCGEGSAHWGRYFLGNGMSVRCVKD